MAKDPGPVAFRIAQVAMHSASMYRQMASMERQTGEMRAARIHHAVGEGLRLALSNKRLSLEKERMGLVKTEFERRVAIEGKPEEIARGRAAEAKAKRGLILAQTDLASARTLGERGDVYTALREDAREQVQLRTELGTLGFGPEGKWSQARFDKMAPVRAARVGGKQSAAMLKFKQNELALGDLKMVLATPLGQAPAVPGYEGRPLTPELRAQALREYGQRGGSSADLSELTLLDNRLRKDTDDLRKTQFTAETVDLLSYLGAPSPDIDVTLPWVVNKAEIAAQTFGFELSPQFAKHKTRAANLTKEMEERKAGIVEDMLPRPPAEAPLAQAFSRLVETPEERAARAQEVAGTALAPGEFAPDLDALQAEAGDLVNLIWGEYKKSYEQAAARRQYSQPHPNGFRTFDVGQPEQQADYQPVPVEKAATSGAPESFAELLAKGQVPTPAELRALSQAAGRELGGVEALPFHLRPSGAAQYMGFDPLTGEVRPEGAPRSREAAELLATRPLHEGIGARQFIADYEAGNLTTEARTALKFMPDDIRSLVVKSETPNQREKGRLIAFANGLVAKSRSDPRAALQLSLLATRYELNAPFLFQGLPPATGVQPERTR